MCFEIHKFTNQDIKSFVRLYVLTFDAENVVLVMEKYIKAEGFGDESVIL